jgi:hypothetical protein
MAGRTTTQTGKLPAQKVDTQGNTSARMSVCPHCAQAFTSPAQLAAHVKQEHRPGPSGAGGN